MIQFFSIAIALAIIIATCVKLNNVEIGKLAAAGLFSIAILIALFPRIYSPAQPPSETGYQNCLDKGGEWIAGACIGD